MLRLLALFLLTSGVVFGAKLNKKSKCVRRFDECLRKAGYWTPEKSQIPKVLPERPEKFCKILHDITDCLGDCKGNDDITQYLEKGSKVSPRSCPEGKTFNENRACIERASGKLLECLNKVPEEIEAMAKLQNPVAVCSVKKQLFGCVNRLFTQECSKEVAREICELATAKGKLETPDCQIQCEVN